jgi:hypothetical protein
MKRLVHLSEQCQGEFMSYLELIQRALKGRSVNSTAKAWGIPQKTLEQNTKGRLPSFKATKMMALDAGIELGAALEMLVDEEEKRKHSDKLSQSFNALLRMVNSLSLIGKKLA